MFPLPSSSLPTLALLALAANERSPLVPLPELGKAEVNCSLLIVRVGRREEEGEEEEEEED
jgi:hypothetical protein